MSRTTKRQTDKFAAKTADGRSCFILEYTEFIDTESFEGGGEIEGIKSYVTQNGDKLNVIGQGVFENRLTGATLRRK